MINTIHLACLLSHSPSDGSVGQLLLLAHHRGGGDLSEASEHQVEDGRRSVRRAFRRDFRRSGGDALRDGAFFQPSCDAAVRMGATDDFYKDHVGVDVGKG